MKKALSVCLCLCLMGMLLNGCAKGMYYQSVNISRGISMKFTTEETEAAIKTVKLKFETLEGCNLSSLTYDEEESNAAIKDYLESNKDSLNWVGEKNIIAIFSDFDVSAYAHCGFEPKSVYTNWCWILTRDNPSSEWVFDNWIY